MTTKDTLALALALEALESVTFHSQGDVGYVECDFDKIGSAITAIKQAITPETGNAATPEASAITAGNGQAQELEQHTLTYSRNLCLHLARKFYPEVAQFEPQDDVLGMLTQIDNMTAELVREPAPKQAEPTPPEAS